MPVESGFMSDHPVLAQWFSGEDDGKEVQRSVCVDAPAD